jgi:hypothetical protein
MPLEFTEQQRRTLSRVLMVQAPVGLTEKQLRQARREINRSVNGLPGDVFMALDALRMLADQGNTVAKDLFEQESNRLGLTRPLHSFRR